jgi:antitoxin component YwqK of YwqJK toxin-antitoxin module
MKNMKMNYLKGIFVLILLNVFCVQAQNQVNKLDEKGNKNGPWTGNYPETNNLKYEGTFDHGKEIGIFTFYDNTKTKRVIATREFSSSDNSAYTIMYDQLKNKVSEGKVINKLSEGKWIYYHKASKTIMSTENYIKGKLEGLRSVYYPSGKIAEEMMYKNSLKNGFYRRYTESGIIIEESFYKDDQYEGLAIFRDPDSGTIVAKGKFTNGKKTGIWQFFEKDKPVKEINMSFPQSKPKSKI